jgi:hypothetical protein
VDKQAQHSIAPNYSGAAERWELGRHLPIGWHISNGVRKSSVAGASGASKVACAPSRPQPQPRRMGKRSSNRQSGEGVMIALPRTMANCCVKAWFLSPAVLDGAIHVWLQPTTDERGVSEGGTHSHTHGGTRRHQAPAEGTVHTLLSALLPRTWAGDLQKDAVKSRQDTLHSAAQTTTTTTATAAATAAVLGQPDEIICAYRLDYRGVKSCYKRTRSKASSACCVVA